MSNRKLRANASYCTEATPDRIDDKSGECGCYRQAQFGGNL
jgi:hypothetical protein